MQKKGVAIIDPVGKKAGMDYYDFSLLDALADFGYPTFIYSNFERERKKTEIKNVFKNTGVHKITAIWNNFWGFIGSLTDCRKKKIEWIILHVFRAGVFDLVTFFISWLLGFKIAIIVHDIESLDTLALPFVRNAVLKSFDKAKIVHNHFAYEKLQEKIGKDDMRRVHIAKHGSFVGMFSQMPSRNEGLKYFNLSPGEKYFLFFGQIKKVKGLDVLLEALALTKNNFKLIVAGKIRDDNWERYQKIIEENKLNNRVITFIKHIPDNERDLLFALSEAVILPYKLIFQSGVLLMTMSSGVPVIASDLNPNKEVIHHGENGVLFKSENPTDLALEMDKFYEGIYDAKKIKKQALELMRTEYSWQAIAGKYNEIFK